MTGFRRVAGVEDIPAGKSKVVDVDSRQIALFNVGGAFYAVDNWCAHRGGPLGEGTLRGTTVTCPWHGAQYDVTNGQALSPPAPAGVRAYPTQVEDGGVWVEVG